MKYKVRCIDKASYTNWNLPINPLFVSDSLFKQFHVNTDQFGHIYMPAINLVLFINPNDA